MVACCRRTLSIQNSPTPDQAILVYRHGKPIASNLIIPRHGTGIEIAHGDDTGVDEAVADVCRGFGIRAVIYPCDRQLGPDAEVFRNRELLRAGADLCVIVCRTMLGKG